ncbi:MAG: radical SAM protein [Pseudomonadota bacterium]
MKIGLVAALNFNPECPTIGKVRTPLGSLCLAALLEPAGYEVVIIDPNLWISKGELCVAKNFEKNLAKKLAAQNCDALGFTTLANTYHHTLKICTYLRKINKNIPLILGGPQATHTAQETLKKFPAIDVIVRGEGDLIFPQLLSALCGEIPLETVQGITYRLQDKIYKTEDAPLIENLDQLPLPAYHLYPVQGDTAVLLDAGRGCPYNCNFCSTCAFWKRRFRQKSAKRIADEMFILKHAFEVKSVDFTHDLFTLERDKVFELCRILKRKKLGLPWTCSTRLDTVDTRMLKAMKAAGCTHIFYGIESGSSRMQKIIGKNINLTKAKQNIQKTIIAGIKTTISFIIGFPQEKTEDLRQTIDLVINFLSLSELVDNVQIHLLAVTNSTRLWDEYHNQLIYDGIQSDQVGGGLIKKKNAFIQKNPGLFPGHYYVKTPHIDRQLFIDLYLFGFVVNNIIRSSTLLACKHLGSGFELVQRWHKWRKQYKGSIIKEKAGDLKLPNAATRQFLERMFSLIKYVRHDPENLGWKNEYLKTIYEHETTLFNYRMLLLNPAKRIHFQPGNVIISKTYNYDLQKIMEGKKTRQKKTRIQYIYQGWRSSGPVIIFRKTS